jgi:hypothetical protein
MCTILVIFELTESSGYFNAILFYRNDGKDIFLEGNLAQFASRIENSQALVAHACNPSYSGGRDQRIAV